jgi:hypothetical protein
MRRSLKCDKCKKVVGFVEEPELPSGFICIHCTAE